MPLTVTWHGRRYWNVKYLWSIDTSIVSTMLQGNVGIGSLDPRTRLKLDVAGHGAHDEALLLPANGAGGRQCDGDKRDWDWNMDGGFDLACGR